jgi:hypothetical protein
MWIKSDVLLTSSPTKALSSTLKALRRMRRGAGRMEWREAFVFPFPCPVLPPQNARFLKAHLRNRWNSSGCSRQIPIHVHCSCVCPRRWRLLRPLDSPPWS